MNMYDHEALLLHLDLVTIFCQFRDMDGALHHMKRATSILIDANVFDNPKLQDLYALTVQLVKSDKLWYEQLPGLCKTMQEVY